LLYLLSNKDVIGAIYIIFLFIYAVIFFTEAVASVASMEATPLNRWYISVFGKLRCEKVVLSLLCVQCLPLLRKAVFTKTIEIYHMALTNEFNGLAKVICIKYNEWKYLFNYDDEARFVREQHAALRFYSARSPKQQSIGRHVASLGQIILIPSQPIFAP
jgi:hypothetical protein